MVINCQLFYLMLDWLLVYSVIIVFLHLIFIVFSFLFLLFSSFSSIRISCTSHQILMLISLNFSLMNLCRSIFYLMPSSICSTIACIDRFTTSQYCFILTLNLIALVSLSSRFWFSYGVFYYLEQTPLLHILRNTSPSHLLSCFWVEISIFQETLVWRV